jgi:hypothetical protein
LLLLLPLLLFLFLPLKPENPESNRVEDMSLGYFARHASPNFWSFPLIGTPPLSRSQSRRNSPSSGKHPQSNRHGVRWGIGRPATTV